MRGFLFSQSIYRNMKKIIRLNESELVSLVKRTIMENNEDIDIEKIIGTYKGENPFIKDLQHNKIFKGYYLTQKEIEDATKFLEDEKLGTKPKINILKKDKPIDTNSLIQELGTKTYLGIIQSEKNTLFNRILMDKQIKISKPDDEWFEENIKNLLFLKENFKSTKGRMKWLDGETSTFEERVNKLIQKCKNKDYIGFIEENEDRKVWSILNKLDTNYTNWRKLIDIRLNSKDGGGIKGENQIEIIENYFKQRDISEVLPPERLGRFIELNKKLSTNVKKLSFADLDLLDAFGKKNSQTLQEIYNNISHTTNIGNQTESNFLMLLRNVKQPIEIVDFSTPGNVVDTAFGIDCAIKIDGVWFAVQIKAGKFAKNAAQKAFVNYLGINSLSIYERNKRFQFNYFSPSKRDGENLFNENFGLN